MALRPVLEAVSTFIVRGHFKERLIKAHASGVAFGDVVVVKSGIFLDTYGERPLPAVSCGTRRPKKVIGD
jgi:hypothetical protein